MIFSRTWLQTQLNSEVSLSALIDQIKNVGFSVKLLSPTTFDFSGIVIGKILSIEPHPNADKLQICSVTVGEGEPLSIVCGASNIDENMIAPIAVVGAILPGNFKIKKAKLRGEVSSGMICSAKELGLSTTSDGILGLPDNAPIGKNAFEYLNLADDLFEIVDPLKSSDDLTTEEIIKKLDNNPISAKIDKIINKLKNLLKVVFRS